MGDYVDAISLSHSGDVPPAADLRAIHRITGKPVMLTGLRFPGPRREWPDADGADRADDWERECADWYKSYVMDLVALPMVVGYHWSDYAERPTEIGSGVASAAVGLVDSEDVPHIELTETVGSVNRAVYRQAAEMGLPAAQ
jgi:hypothetical protein